MPRFRNISLTFKILPHLPASSFVCPFPSSEHNKNKSTEPRAQRARHTHKTAELTLGRDGGSVPILQVQTATGRKRYKLSQTIIHRKFLKEGKSTLDLKDEKVQLMISNCPPDQLLQFLKTLVAKLAKHKMTGRKTSSLDSLLGAPFTEISPLCEQDIACVRVPPKHDTTPSRNSLTRKRNHAEDKENVNSKVVKRELSLKNTLSELTPEQYKVLEAITQGKNVFFTGSAGTGKSFLLQRAVGSLAPEHTFVTASTGIAASHISGMTLHSFAGIGSGKGTVDHCVELASRPAVLSQWRKCRHLIIDEISMVDGELFAKLDAVARVVRKSEKPFGGVQLILCGDFFQLPPVEKSSSNNRQFCFQTSAWKRCVDVVHQLRWVKRQTDKSFVDLLNSVRRGQCPAAITATLTSTANRKLGDALLKPTKLSSHNRDVDMINDESLEQLQGESRTFTAADNSDGLTQRINDLCPAQREITLKIGAQVMVVKNVSVRDGLVNGARGVVTGFESNSSGYPIVRFLSGKKFTIKPEKYTFKWSAGITLSRKQLPLRLAWAVSIHKSQGMTLDLVEMSLSRVFEYGQAYVALSRARSLEGLRVVDFSPDCVRAHPSVVEYYKQLDRRVAGDYL